MSSNVLAVTKTYTYREYTLISIGNEGAEIFSTLCVIQMRIEYHHVRLHTDRETVYSEMFVWKCSAEFSLL